MSKFCSKCGNELMDEAAFCSKCGTKTEIEKKELETNKEPITESTGPAAIDLKAALSLILEVTDYIENAEDINKSEYKGMEKRIVDAEKTINKANETDSTIEVLFTGTNDLINCEQALAYNDYIKGRLEFDIETILLGRRPEGKLIALKRAMKNFEISINRDLTPWACFFNARAIHELYKVKTKNWILPQKKLKQTAIEAYQLVIDNWSDSELAVEARKHQAQLQ